jgi:hypothetical protein
LHFFAIFRNFFTICSRVFSRFSLLFKFASIRHIPQLSHFIFNQISMRTKYIRSP